MEIGNAVFGNSRGSHLIDRAKWGQAFYDRPGISDFIREDKLPDGWRSVSVADHEYYTNDRWIIMHYYWGYDEMVCRLPNFVDLETGIEIQWYKYPLRYSYSNVPIPDEWWSTIDLNVGPPPAEPVDGPTIADLAVNIFLPHPSEVDGEARMRRDVVALSEATARGEVMSGRSIFDGVLDAVPPWHNDS